MVGKAIVFPTRGFKRIPSHYSPLQAAVDPLHAAHRQAVIAKSGDIWTGHPFPLPQFSFKHTRLSGRPSRSTFQCWNSHEDALRSADGAAFFLCGGFRSVRDVRSFGELPAPGARIVRLRTHEACRHEHGSLCRSGQIFRPS